MMSRLKRMKTGFPLHHLLIIVFFVLEGNNEFYPDVPLIASLKLFVSFILVALICYLVCKLILREKLRAAVISFFLVYGIVYARTIYHYYSIPFGNYRVSNTHFFLVAAVVLIGIVIIIYRSAPASLRKFNRFLTILFAVLILFTSGSIIYKWLTPSRQLSLQLSNSPDLSQLTPKTKPNIYLLMFDEYQGNDGLKSLYGNNDISPDSMLIRKGFRVMSHPSSNYNYTFYSVPSLLNMSYLDFNDNKLDYDLRRVVKSVHTLTNKSPLLNYFNEEGYDIINHSFFQLGDIPSTYQSLVVPHDGYSAIYSRTIFGWAKEDLLHSIGSNEIQQIIPSYFYQVYQYNNEVISGMDQTINNKTIGTKFVYSHLLIPHPPVLTDSIGNLRKISTAMYEVNRQEPSFKSSYKKYIQYANSILDKMVTGIQANDPTGVIVFTSDHGLRVIPRQEGYIFNNQCAVYIPGSNYAGFYDSVSLVNLMRLVLNNASGLQIPLVADKKHPSK